MSAAKHTPGPWKYWPELIPEIFGERFGISQQEGAPYTSNYSDVATTCSGDPIGIQEANARLIAAAPELLEFAEEVRRSGDTRLASMAIAAIAKATGAAA